MVNEPLSDLDCHLDMLQYVAPVGDTPVLLAFSKAPPPPLPMSPAQGPLTSEGVDLPTLSPTGQDTPPVQSVAPWQDDLFVVDDDEDSGSDGFGFPAAYGELWDLVSRALVDVGLVGGKLAVQQGDESALLSQVVNELQLSISGSAREYLLHRLYQEVEKAVQLLPLQKRARGEYADYKLARILDASEGGRWDPGIGLGGSSSSTAVPPYPPKGNRARRSKLGTAGLSPVGGAGGSPR